MAKRKIVYRKLKISKTFINYSCCLLFRMEFLKNHICVTDHVFFSKFQEYKTRLPIIGRRNSQGTKVRKITSLKKKGFFLVKLRNTGANPINIITPMPKFWSWHNYNKSLFQSYKAVLLRQKTFLA
jgi:hypothetical protein